MPAAKKAKEAPPLLNMDTIEVEYPKWVWFPYIPANSATLLFGRGGVGKSYISCEIASALSSGRPLPGQEKGDTRKHRVLMMSAEDSLGAVIKPRLMRCGANLSRISCPDEPFTLDEWGLRQTAKYMDECGASVVIIDPIVHYLGGKIDMNKMNEVRQVTGALHQMARETECSFLILHHARKGSDGWGYERAAGSADFINSARSGLYAAKKEDGTCVMSHVKTNYGIHGKSQSYYIDEDGFHWNGECDDDDELIKPQDGKKQGQRRGPGGSAVPFLKATLENGPVRSIEVVKLAEDEGIARATLNRAKNGVADSIVRFKYEERRWYWRLRDDDREPPGVTLRAEPEPGRGLE